MTKRNTVTIDPDWLEKEPAAKRLGVGMRQLENRAAKGEIRKSKMERQPHERAARVLYSIQDIDAIKAGKPNQYGEVDAPAEAKSDLQKQLIKSGDFANSADPFAGLAAHLAKLSAAFPSAAEPAKPWLSLKEAAEYSGLPAAWLLEQARAGQLRAVNTGKGSREFWKFNRAALEK